MVLYQMKNTKLEATEIDAQWLLFLTQEKGFKDVSVGDYFHYTDTGSINVMPKKNFERLFERVV